MTAKPSWKSIALLTIVVGIGVAITLFFLPGKTMHPVAAVTPPIKQTKHAINDKKQQPIHWQKVIVQAGDSLDGIFSRLKINHRDLAEILQQHKSLALIHPGDELYFQIDQNHRLLKMQYAIDSLQTAILQKKNNHFITKLQHKPTTTILSFKAVTIHHSLYQDAKYAGLTHKLIHQLKSIFEGSVNFSRDIHPGDRFALLYQEFYVNGKKFRNGNIMAASLTCKNKTYHAIRYTYPIAHTGYYTPDGHAVESRFLRKPVKYKRISSHFSRHRLDPVIHRVHPHLGIDFAAYRGTPIKSIGDGKVIFIGRDGGYGKAIKVRYGKHYVALYGHMSRFAKNVKFHTRVHKGQVIGYVGKTGWATGPHLHFGFYVNGKARDWLSMKMPTGKSIPSSHFAHFLAASKRLLAQLKLYQQTKLAANTTKTLRHD